MIYIIAIEPIETRYTGHWAKFVPDIISSHTHETVQQIMGEILETELTQGAFFNFNSTIYFKNIQNNRIVELFNNHAVQNGDYFLIMDAWNATAHQIRYMANLNNIDIKIGGIWHAGSYDDNDFLGRQFKDKEWSYSLEKSLYLLYDHNFFATEYHLKLFERKIGISGKSIRTGFPMEYYKNIPEIYFDKTIKENLVLFPHRISEEKRPDLFREISSICAVKYPHINFCMCQESVLSKTQYHDLLRKAKIVFSANKQETLGIGVYEGLLCGAIPFVPDDLAYSEMYSDQYMYDISLIDKPEILADMIAKYIYTYNSYTLNDDITHVTTKFFTGTILYDTIEMR